MACLCRRQTKAPGQVLVVNAPYAAMRSQFYDALSHHMPMKLLSPESGYFPGVSGAMDGKNLMGTMAQSALHLADEGQLPVLDLQDPTHASLAELASHLSTAVNVPVTSVLMYVPLTAMAQETVTDMPGLLKGLQEYGHLFQASFEPSEDTIATLTRPAFDKFFAKLMSNVTGDVKSSLENVSSFLSALLGLDVQSEVYLSPRHAVFDSVVNLENSPKEAAEALVGLLRSAADSRRVSALHRTSGLTPSAMSACPECQSGALSGTVTQLQAHTCLDCLDCTRMQLLGSNVNALPSPGTALVPSNAWHDNLRYNEVLQKCSKNCNARSESLLDQLLYHHVRSLELDISPTKGAFIWAQRAPARDWWMAHETGRGLYESHQFDKLSEVLGRLKAFHEIIPDHEVVTLFINVHDNFGGNLPQRGHRPEDLDALLLRHLGSDLLYTPRQFKGDAPTLQAAAKKGWPSLRSLVGKFMPVIVAGGSAYADAQDLAENKQCFVARQNVAHRDFIHRHNWIVFFDQNSKTDLVSPDIHKSGFISRHGVESQFAYQQALRKRAHHLVTKSINSHHNTWAKTHTPKGYPFLTFTNGHKGFDTTNAAEPVRVLCIRATTGDLWGLRDNAVFASHEDSTPDGKWVEYQWVSSNANSHMNKNAKAGIAFRSSRDDEGAAYFSLLRPAHYKSPPLVQLRSHLDGTTTTSAGRNAQAIHFKVRCRYVGSSTECEAYTSDDGKRWRLVRSTSVGGRLNQHGVIASSGGNKKHTDTSQYRFVFVNLAKDGKPLTKTDLPAVSDIGNVFLSGKLCDGFDNRQSEAEFDEFAEEV